MAERVPFANLGAEEGPSEPLRDSTPIGRLAMHFDAVVRRPPWRALDDVDGVVAWMNTSEALAEAARLELPLWGARADVVRRVHDKGFAQRLGLDEELAGIITVLEPAELEVARIEHAIGLWPSWARADATLKPRWGTSGRGRVPVKAGVLDERGRNSLAGLRARGGAVLEPWLDRVLDLSSQWLVDEYGEPHLLGCTRMVTRRSGVWLGCDVHRDHDGQGSGTSWDPDVVKAARPVVEAAAAAGYVGVCGVDAFTWQRDGVERLRGVVELNARFTGGVVALASLYGRWGKATFRIQD